jgi:rhodanese-related sulfurtransferase
MGLFSFLNPGANSIKEALLRDAVIIDVRPPSQYDQGKIPGSLNIPFEQIAKSAGYIKRMGKPVIFCGNGPESGTAKTILQQSGLKEVYNGGSWQRVLRLKSSV